MTQITRDEWLRALADVEPADDSSYMTAAELRALWGVGERAARTSIQKLIAAQRVTVGSKFITDNTGRRQRVPAYRLVP